MVGLIEFGPLPTKKEKEAYKDYINAPFFSGNEKKAVNGDFGAGAAEAIHEANAKRETSLGIVGEMKTGASNIVDGLKMVGKGVLDVTILGPLKSAFHVKGKSLYEEERFAVRKIGKGAASVATGALQVVSPVLGGLSFIESAVTTGLKDNGPITKIVLGAAKIGIWVGDKVEKGAGLAERGMSSVANGDLKIAETLQRGGERLQHAVSDALKPTAVEQPKIIKEEITADKVPPAAGTSSNIAALYTEAVKQEVLSVGKQVDTLVREAATLPKTNAAEATFAEKVQQGAAPKGTNVPGHGGRG